MRRTEILQEVRRMRSEEAYGVWAERRLIQEEGTSSSFQGVRDVILHKCLFSSLYIDRGSHYWYTPERQGEE